MAATPFSALRLSQENFDAYKRRLPQRRTRSLPSDNARLVKVTGYGEEAKEAIIAASDASGDTIAVPWTPFDSVLCIMRRVEEKLRIPLKHWCLAGHGRVLKSSMPVGGHSLFSSKVVELLLVPSNKLKQFKGENPSPKPEPYGWRQLERGTTDSADPLEKAKAAYHLINPAASTAWENYYAQRQKAEDQLKEMTESNSFDESETLADQVKKSVKYVVEDLNLDEEQQLSIADGVLPQDLFYVDEGDGDPREATVFTRIYSPNKPAAVDVYFRYWHKARWESVDFTCALFIRVHDPVDDADAPKAGSPINRDGGAARGWIRVFRMAFDSYPPGRRCYAKRIMDWGLRASQVNEVHTALFGRAGHLPASAVEKVDTVRLLLAAAGIPFYVARAEDESDKLDPERIGFRWECFHDQWIGTNIREASGAPLEKDADWEISEDDNPYEDEEDSENDGDYW